MDQEYYDEVIRPLLDPPFIEYIGEISDQDKSEFLSGAIALLVTIDWPEPFGLVMIEAMACGTPVIAFNRGSVPEIVEDDVTGFIVEDEISSVSAVNRVCELDRNNIRARPNSVSRRDGWPWTIWRPIEMSCTSKRRGLKSSRALSKLP